MDKPGGLASQGYLSSIDLGTRPSNRLGRCALVTLFMLTALSFLFFLIFLPSGPIPALKAGGRLSACEANADRSPAAVTAVCNSCTSCGSSNSWNYKGKKRELTPKP